jgi:hypothetical protein
VIGVLVSRDDVHDYPHRAKGAGYNKSQMTQGVIKEIWQQI